MGTHAVPTNPLPGKFLLAEGPGSAQKDWQGGQQAATGAGGAGECMGPAERGDIQASGRGNVRQVWSGNNAAPAKFTALLGKAVRAGEGKAAAGPGDITRAWLFEDMCSCVTSVKRARREPL